MDEPDLFLTSLVEGMRRRVGMMLEGSHGTNDDAREYYGEKYNEIRDLATEAIGQKLIEERKT